MYTSNTQIRVRYAETDQMGFVYYGNYATYFEVARVESLREIGLNYKEFEDNGILMPVINLNCNFKKPAVYDDLLSITTKIIKMPGVRIFFEYDVLNQNGELLTQASTTLIFMNAKNNKPVLCPKVLADKLLPYFG